MVDNGVSEAVEWLKIITPPGAVALLGWWLKGQFTGVESHVMAWLAKHEQQDERRHRQNLIRFTKIGVRLDIPDIVISEEEGDYP